MLPERTKWRKQRRLLRGKKCDYTIVQQTLHFFRRSALDLPHLPGLKLGESSERQAPSQPGTEERMGSHPFQTCSINISAIHRQTNNNSLVVERHTNAKHFSARRHTFPESNLALPYAHLFMGTTSPAECSFFPCCDGGGPVGIPTSPFSHGRRCRRPARDADTSYCDSVGTRTTLRSYPPRDFGPKLGS